MDTKRIIQTISFAVFAALAVTLIWNASRVSDRLSINASTKKTLSLEEKETIVQFGEFISQFNKVYSSEEEKAARYEIFKANILRIRARNSEGRGFSLGINQFADLSPSEFKTKYTGKLKPRREQQHVEVNHALSTVDLKDLPSEVDWRQKGCVTEVKDQGQCGSCWAFSTTGAVEGAWCAAGRGHVDLSEQELVDCSAKEGNEGCNGGEMSQGMQFIIDNGGICSESAYPYIAHQHDGAKGCAAKTCTDVATIKSFAGVPANDPTALMAAVATYGPIAVGIDAESDDFQMYSGGVYDASCGTQLDHGVLLVGYGTDSETKQDYWLVKNSWGSGWGEGGYIRFTRSKGGSQGECGIAMDATYAIVEKS